MAKVNLWGFTQTPGGRFREDGKFSAEEFRDERVLPALEEHEYVIVDVSGTLGLPSPFLEELFGGLVRKVGAEKVVNKVFPALNTPLDKVQEIYEYIGNAAEQEFADKIEEEMYWKLGD